MLSDEQMDQKRKIYGRYFEAFPEAAAECRAIWALREAERDARVDKWLGAALETTHPFGSEFFDNFMNGRTEAGVSRDEVQDAQRGYRRANSWVSQRYASRRKTYNHPITLDDIRSVLGCLDPYILEDILLLGVAVDIRCIIMSAVMKMRPTNDARPSREILAQFENAKHHRRWHDDLQLCNSRIHDKDSDMDASEHALKKKITQAYEHAKMRKGLQHLIHKYIDVTEIGDLKHAIDAEYSNINTNDLDSHLNIDSVVGIFKAISYSTCPEFMECVFILGCAAAIRNLVTCFQGIMALDKHDEKEYDEIKWFFRYCNAKNFELGWNTNPKFHTELEIYYHMLCDIMHGLDTTSHNLFFRGPLFAERFNTIRWEVLNLVFTFLVKLPDHTPIRSRFFLRSLVRFGTDCVVNEMPE